MPLKTEQELSDNSRANWAKAKSAVEIRNYGYAVALLQAILKETPEFLEGRKLLRTAQILAHKGKKSLFGGLSSLALMGKGPQLLKKDPVAALNLAEETLANDPLNNAANHLLKDAALALDQFDLAVFSLYTVAEGSPKDTKIWNEIGELYLSHGQPDKALEAFNKILAINPNDMEANKRAKDAAAANTMKTGGWNTAKDYRDLIKNKDEAVALEQKNRVVKDEASIEAILEELTQKIQEQPENIDDARRIASLYEDKKDYANAAAWYNYASELSKGADNWLLRKVGDMQLKQVDESIAQREEWLAQAGEDHPESARVREELEGLKKQKGESLLDEARKAVDRNPTDLQFRFELGEQLIINNMVNEAIPELQKARNNPNVRLRAINLLGKCYVEKGMLDLAVKQFTDAVNEMLVMDATKKDILYQLGGVYEKMGKKDKALDCFKQIYEVDYSYKDVAQRVESSYQA